MTNTGMTVSPGALAGLAAGLRGDGHRVGGLAEVLCDDAEMAGSRTFGALIHATALWREELRKEGRILDGLGAAADEVGRAIGAADARNDAAFGAGR